VGAVHVEFGRSGCLPGAGDAGGWGSGGQLLRLMMTTRVLCLVSLLLLAPGCARGPVLYPVEGAVTMDGSDIADGDIIFESLDPHVPSAAGKIKDGRFHFKTQAGPKRVRIYATRAIPGTEGKGMMGTSLLETVVPPEFNLNSELNAEVTSEGSKQFDFHLKKR